jgi:hypothetical protein
MKRALVLMSCLALMGAKACGEEPEVRHEHLCTTEQRFALRVQVSGDLSQVKTVTAENTEGEIKCLRDDVSREDAGPTTERTYACFEQGVGQYTIRVNLVGGETLTETVELSGDACHVDSLVKPIEFELP